VNECGLCERPDETGGYLCLGCTKDTRVRLECWPDLYDGLALFLAPSVSGPQGRGSKPTYAPLPVSVDVLDLRGPGGLVGAAEGWLAVIRRDRRLPVREPRGGAVEARLQRAVAELLGHLPWVVVSWPDAAQFAEDIREVTRSVSSIVRPEEPTPRSMTLGRCVALREGGAVCGATVRLHPGEKAGRCQWCGMTWPPCTWAQLKAWQDEDARAAAEAEKATAGEVSDALA
jgi:hypothetical protein